MFLVYAFDYAYKLVACYWMLGMLFIVIDECISHVLPNSATKVIQFMFMFIINPTFDHKTETKPKYSEYCKYGLPEFPFRFLFDFCRQVDSRPAHSQRHSKINRNFPNERP